MAEFRKQFLLCHDDKVADLIKMKKMKISNFHLYYHEQLKFSEVKTKTTHFILLGNLFSYSKPNLLNDEILLQVSKAKSKQELFENINPFYGEYILIASICDEIIIFNDPCAQNEIYYNQDFTCFASQIKLMKEAIDVELSKEDDTAQYYCSDEFNEKKYFVLNTTPYRNIKHLQPNHFLDVKNKLCERFFPLKTIEKKSVDEVAKLASRMIKGYLEAISYRYKKIKLPVTAGYDSRVLFLASLSLECEYYIDLHSSMNEDHYDVVVAKKLLNIFDKSILIRLDKDLGEEDFDKSYISTIDFPRLRTDNAKFFNDSVLINGNISEIARSYFGDFKNTSPQKLAFLNKYSGDSFVVKNYKEWLNKNRALLKEKGYNYLDVFYWEEKMGNWTSKAKTEANASGIEMMSPYNSRELMELMLSVRRKYRNNYKNILYDKIICHLSNGNRKVSTLPINPYKMKIVYIILQKIKLFNTFQNLRFIKRRLLDKLAKVS